MDGNSAQTDPTQTQLGPVPEPGQTTTTDAQPDIAQKLAKLEEQYSASSREGHRLAEELKQERDARLRLEGSLKSQTQVRDQQQFPARDAYVKARVEMGQDERLAGLQWEESKINYDNQLFLSNQLKATQNMLRFQTETNERTFSQTNPDAQRAKEFFKDIPELAALPVGDQIQRHKEILAKTGVKLEGRDTTALKMAASGGGTSSGSRGVDSPTADLDAQARAGGIFSCHKEMIEASQCKTQHDYNEHAKRWKKK